MSRDRDFPDFVSVDNSDVIYAINQGIKEITDKLNDVINSIVKQNTEEYLICFPNAVYKSNDFRFVSIDPDKDFDDIIVNVHLHEGTYPIFMGNYEECQTFLSKMKYIAKTEEKA